MTKTLPEDPITDVLFRISDSFTCFDNIRERIIFRLVNRKANHHLLTKIPHIDYLDLAVTFVCLLSVRDSGDATILINSSHLEKWQLSADDLLATAKQNTPRLLPWEMSNMTDILQELSTPDDDLIPRPQELSYPMYILTNRIRLHGAGCILYDGLLPSLAKTLGDDLYIIPSSIHEVLLIPSSVVTDRRDLDAMIHEVNTTQVPDEEILSDHAYQYIREMGRVVF